jgi:hypothetical protein
MTAPTETGQSDWLAEVASRAALRHGARNDEFAQRMKRELLADKNAELDDINAIPSSQARVGRWEALFRLASDAALFRFLAYRPQDAICMLGPGLPEVRRWSTLTEIYEACYSLVTRSAGEADAGRGTPYAWRLGSAHLARTRWMLLSQPFTGIGRPLERDLLRVNDEPGRVVALAQQARDDWLGVLGTIDDYPQLAARIGDIEADAAGIAASQITPAVLGLDSEDEAADGGDPVGRQATEFAVTRLLLPRFAWPAATRVYLRFARRLSLALSAAACLAVLASIVELVLGFALRWTGGYTAAAVTAIAVYVLVASAIAAEPSAAWPWLLRQPASAAVGLLALAAFGPEWWYTGGAHGDTARAAGVIAGLAAASLLYLYIEAAGHGVRGRRLARRPLLVTLSGLIHGVLVSIIGLRFLLPVFAPSPQNGPALSCWYASGSCHGLALPVPALLGLAATWSLAAGVFLQIVWDDQPVTSPLAHVSWHRRG